MADDGDQEPTDWTLDPLSRPMAFASRVGSQLVTCGDKAIIGDFQPLDTRVDSFLDFDKLEALATFEGGVKAPKARSSEDYSSDLEDMMRIMEPQFILRSLSRVVREGGPDEPLPLEEVPSEREQMQAALKEVRQLETEPLEFIDKMTYQRVAEHRNWFRWLVDDEAWERHFSREIKEDFSGPLWSHDPDATEPDQESSDA